MNLKQLILEQQTETKEIIAELLDDGSDPEAIYTIEHHFYTQDIDLLERFAVEAFKQGFEVSDPEEIIDENDSPLICCDVISEIPLEAPLINQQIEQLLFIADKFSVHYDGWGTYFEGDEEDEDGDDDEYDEDEESDKNGSDDGEDDDDDFDDDDDNEEIDFNRH